MGVSSTGLSWRAVLVVAQGAQGPGAGAAAHGGGGLPGPGHGHGRDARAPGAGVRGQSGDLGAVARALLRQRGTVLYCSALWSRQFEVLVWIF